MKREEATALLKDLLNYDLVQPSYVHLKRNEHGHFDLVIKCDCDVIELRKLVVEKDLALLVDTEQGTCRIYKP